MNSKLKTFFSFGCAIFRYTPVFCFEFSVPGFGVWDGDLRVRTPAGTKNLSSTSPTRFRIGFPGFVFRVSSLDFLVSGFWFLVLGLGFLVSGFGFRISGFRFRVSNF